MYKTGILVLIWLPCGLSLQAQQKPKPDTTVKNVLLDEVVISATNFTEKKKNIAQQIDIVTAKQIAQTNAQNTGDLLLSTGKIAVQKSQQGGSSPILRGFEASRILLIVDGVRMNNAIFRAGHLQNSITADQNMLSRVEVMYGPSSTIYGGDALGGAIHLISKPPVLSTTDKLHSTGSSFYRYSTVNRESTAHADMSIGGKKWAWLQSYNYSNFGDLKMGRHFPDRYPNFGRRDSFITTTGLTDQIVANPNPLVQKSSGYRQWDITQKLLLKPGKQFTHLLNLQYSSSSNIPRYDRLQDTRNGRLRYAEWYYGPQQRFLAAYELNGINIRKLGDIRININFQEVKESRQTREYNRFDRFDSRRERVKIWGGTASARKIMGMHELTYGADVQLNNVISRADRTNLATGIKSKLDTRYPNGKNVMNNYGLFAQHIYKFGNGKWILNDGLRLQYVHLHSSIADNSLVNLPVTEFKQKNLALSGNIGLVRMAGNTVIKSTLSSGFRAPNIDDLAKIFESSAALKQVVVPNAGLKPEYTYGLDFQLNQKLGKNAAVELTVYHTWFVNALALRPFTINGQDSIEYNGVNSQVVAMQNVASARLWGFSASLQVAISQYLTLNSTISYSWGRYNADPAKPSVFYERMPNGSYALVSRGVKSLPLDHVPPIIGRTAVNFQKGKWSSELACLYNGWKRTDQMNATGEDNVQYATPDGFPAWVLLNWRGNFQITKALQLQTGVENLLNRHYRMFASGFSGGGRNFFISLRAQW